MTLTFIFITAAILHGDFKTLICGIVYWCCIPSCFIFLQIYSIANLNDCSWGTRQGGGGKNKKTPFDKAVDMVKGCCIGCCKCPQAEEEEEISEGGTPACKQVKAKNIFQVNRLEKAPKCTPQDDSENHLSDLIDSNDAPSLLMSNNKQDVDVEDPDHTNKEMNEIFKDAQNLNFPKIDENDTKSSTERLNCWKPTAGPTNSDDENGYISLNQHQHQALHEGHIFWMKSSVCPEFFNNNPRVAALDPIEYKFWLGMVDPKCGFIRPGLLS